ncbi:MAG: DNA polymerase III subunit delta [Anaerovoracaceae bacterium]|jgi:DNA polymerase-3 subunit delta
MANKNNVAVEHAYKQLDTDLKKKALKGLLLFYGDEAYLIDWGIDTIIQKYVTPACTELDFSKLNGETVTLDEIKNNCETLPMLSPKRVVLIENFKILEGTKTKNIGENEEKELIKYLSSLPDSCLLILTSPRVDKRKKIFKTISQEGTAYDFCRLEPKQLRAWISKKFKEAGKKASSEVIGELVAFSGYYDKESDYTLYHMDNDLKKIIAYSDGPEILWNNINNNLSGNINTFIFDMIDAVSKGKKEEAFQLLHNLLLYGENEYKILALICSQFEAILSVKELQEEGQNEREIKNILGIHEFRIKKAREFGRSYSVNHLRKVLQKAYEVDRNIKSGLLEASLALEMFIAEI